MHPKYKIKSNPELVFVKFNKDDHIDPLYSLLVKRSHNISHQDVPTKGDHRKFCLSNQYRFWYLIYQDLELVGTFYISKENAIGIQIIDEFCYLNKPVLKFILDSFKPRKPVPSIVPPYFFCNIAPDHSSLIEAAKELNGDKCQVTYRFEKIKE